MFLTINDTNINILCKFGFLNGLVSVVWNKVKSKKVEFFLGQKDVDDQ